MNRRTSKKRRKRARWIVIIASLTAIAAGCVVAIASRQYHARVHILSQTIATLQEELRQARLTALPRYAPACFVNVSALHDTLLTQWKEQNSRPWYSRDTRSLIAQTSSALTLIRSCHSAAAATKDSLQSDLSTLLPRHERELARARSSYGHLPLPRRALDRITEAELLRTESRLAYERGDLILAHEKLSRSSSLLSDAVAQSHTIVSSYMLSLPRWQEWSRRTIEESRRTGTSAIIIDKIAGECLVYSKGTLLHTFRAEFGSEWMKQKNKAGDKATPEGIYRVTRVKSNGATIYHKALEIDYPNNDDKKRITALKKTGMLPADAHTGGDIEIHGGGGRGIHWTDGCAALSDRDMDIVFRKCPVGTRVTIVGALSSPGIQKGQQ